MTVLLVWLHMLAAVSWIGGTIFRAVVLMRCSSVNCLCHRARCSSDHHPSIQGSDLGAIAILFIEPRVGRILQIPTESRSGFDHTMAVWSPWIARCSFLLTLAVLLAAVVLGRN